MLSTRTAIHLAAHRGAQVVALHLRHVALARCAAERIEDQAADAVADARVPGQPAVVESSGDYIVVAVAVEVGRQDGAGAVDLLGEDLLGAEATFAVEESGPAT